MRIRGTLLVLWAAVLLTPAGHAEAALTPCNTFAASQEPPSGYGSAFNVAQETAEALISVECDGERARVTVGSDDDLQYAYRIGYLWRNERWQQLDLTGDGFLGRSWYAGPARTTITLSADEQGTDMFVVGYVCTWVENEWKCGCRDTTCERNLWQLQRFTYARDELPDDIGQGYSGPPLLQGPTSYTVNRGASVALLGAGFGSSNRITFTDREGTERTIAPVSSSRGGTRTGEFTIPNDLPFGMHRVSLHRAGVESDNETFLIVTRPGVPGPQVTSVSPSTVTQGSTVTVRGSGFTPENNDVLTTFGDFRGIPSADGTSLQFDLRVFPDEPLLETPRSSVEQESIGELYLYVRNDNGISAQPLTIELQL